MSFFVHITEYLNASIPFWRKNIILILELKIFLGSSGIRTLFIRFTVGYITNMLQLPFEVPFGIEPKSQDSNSCIIPLYHKTKSLLQNSNPLCLLTRQEHHHICLRGFYVVQVGIEPTPSVLQTDAQTSTPLHRKHGLKESNLFVKFWRLLSYLSLTHVSRVNRIRTCIFFIPNEGA